MSLVIILFELRDSDIIITQPKRHSPLRVYLLLLLLLQCVPLNSASVHHSINRNFNPFLLLILQQRQPDSDNGSEKRRRSVHIISSQNPWLSTSASSPFLRPNINGIQKLSLSSNSLTQNSLWWVHSVNWVNSAGVTHSEAPIICWTRVRKLGSRLFNVPVNDWRRRDVSEFTTSMLGVDVAESVDDVRVGGLARGVVDSAATESAVAAALGEPKRRRAGVDKWSFGEK